MKMANRVFKVWHSLTVKKNGGRKNGTRHLSRFLASHGRRAMRDSLFIWKQFTHSQSWEYKQNILLRENHNLLEQNEHTQKLLLSENSALRETTMESRQHIAQQEQMIEELKESIELVKAQWGSERELMQQHTLDVSGEIESQRNLWKAAFFNKTVTFMVVNSKMRAWIVWKSFSANTRRERELEAMAQSFFAQHRMRGAMKKWREKYQISARLKKFVERKGMSLRNRLYFHWRNLLINKRLSELSAIKSELSETLEAVKLEQFNTSQQLVEKNSENDLMQREATEIALENEELNRLLEEQQRRGEGLLEAIHLRTEYRAVTMGLKNFLRRSFLTLRKNTLLQKARRVKLQKVLNIVCIRKCDFAFKLWKTFINNSKIMRLEEELNTARSHVEQLLIQAEGMERRLSEERSAISNLSIMGDESNQRKFELEIEVAKLNSEVENLQRQLSDRGQHIQYLIDENSKLGSSLKRVDDGVMELNAELLKPSPPSLLLRSAVKPAWKPPGILQPVPHSATKEPGLDTSSGSLHHSIVLSTPIRQINMSRTMRSGGPLFSGVHVRRGRGGGPSLNRSALDNSETDSAVSKEKGPVPANTQTVPYSAAIPPRAVNIIGNLTKDARSRSPSLERKGGNDNESHRSSDRPSSSTNILPSNDLNISNISVSPAPSLHVPFQRVSAQLANTAALYGNSATFPSQGALSNLHNSTSNVNLSVLSANPTGSTSLLNSSGSQHQLSSSGQLWPSIASFFGRSS